MSEPVDNYAFIGQAITILLGGGTLTMVPPDVVVGYQTDAHSRIVPKEMRGVGAAVTHLVVDGWQMPVAVYDIDVRCRELFGFGLLREEDQVSLKRRPAPKTNNVDYTYRTDEHGRMMIVGDYDAELNHAYMLLQECELDVIDGPDTYVYVNTARIYLSDLNTTAAWCGHTLIVNNGKACIIAMRAE